MREQMRATLAEESNIMLKEEITKHKKTQARLRDAEEFNRSIIESSIDMIVAFDMEGNLQQYNHAFSVEFGIEPNQESTPNFKEFLIDEKTANGVFDRTPTKKLFFRRNRRDEFSKPSVCLSL